MIDEVIERLKQKSHRDYQEFNEGLKVSNVLGVRIKDVEQIAKDIVKEHKGFNYLDSYKKAYYETDLIYGMIVGIQKMDDDKRLYYMNEFVGLIDNWATCDSGLSRWKFMKKDLEGYKPFVSGLLEKPDEFKNRVSYVLLLDYYLKEDPYFVLDQLSKPINEAYYSSMAASWLISMGLVKHQELFEEYITHHPLSDFVYQKSLSKAIESYQCDSETKDKYRQWKKDRRQK